jgi:alpha-1,2-mannosyltransferase
MLTGWRVRALWSLFVAVGLISSVLVLQRPAFDRLADLHVYYGAVRWVQGGQPLYEFSADNGDPFTYPPFAAVVLWPLGWLPEPVVQVAWLVAVCAAAAGIALILARRWEQVDRRGLFAAVTACVLIASAPVQSNLRFGQVSIFIVLLVLVDALGFTPPRWRGVLIGLAAAIKLTPLLFVVFFVISGRRREAIRATAAFLAAGFAAAVLLPHDSVRFWTSALFTTSRIGDLASLGNQSLHALLARAGIYHEAFPIVWAALVLAICGLALWRAWHLSMEGKPAHAVVLVGCATIAASPVSWTHHQIWPVLAGMILVASAGATRKAAGVFLLVAMLLNLGNLAVESFSTPGLQYLFDNARGLGVVVLCCMGFGGPLVWFRARRRVPTSARRPAIKHGLVTIAAGVVMFALLPLPPSSDPSLRFFTLAETIEQFSHTHISCDGGPCDMSWGGRLLLNYSVGSNGERHIVEGWVAAKVVRLAMRTAPGAPMHSVPIMDIGDGQRVFCFSGTNLYYAQFLAYDAQGRLIENPPRDLWK